MIPEHLPLPPNIISLCGPWLPKNGMQGHFSIYCRLFPLGASSNSLRNLLESTLVALTAVLKMSFIIVWKVAGLLVIPKNITRGLKRPWLVRKATFHSSLDLMHILLKPQQTSSFVKYQALRSWETSWEMRRRGYLFLMVTAFSA